MPTLPTISDFKRLLPYLKPHERAKLDRLLNPRPRLTLEAWAQRYLLVKNDAKGTTEAMRPGSGFHRWLVDELDKLHRHRGSKWVVIAPRGSAKTTWACLAYPLRCALENHERYIQIVSDTAGQARQNLENIRAELEENESLNHDYPAAAGKGPLWTQDRIRLRNSVTIEALGMGSALRGRRQRWERPTLIVVDDPEKDEHATSALLRQKSWAWFSRAVPNAGSPATNYLALGTALHRECLVMRLRTQPGWQSRVFQSIVEWPQRMDLWTRWETIFNDHENPTREADALAFYEANRAAMEE
jgi:hypothetical protein